MTREEAIEELEILKEEYWDDDGYGNETKQYDDTMTALDMAIEALKEPRWIPITERLPEENGKYFVMYRERKEKIIRVGIDYFMEIDGELGFWCFDVIKWMPIPEYKENKE